MPEQDAAQLSAQELELFAATPEVLGLYAALRDAILAAFPQAAVQVGSSQVSFKARYGFAFLWPPRRRAKGWPRLFVGLSLGLPHRPASSRIVQAAHISPHRWTCHLLLESIAQLDDEVMAWLWQAWELGQTGVRGLGRAGE